MNPTLHMLILSFFLLCGPRKVIKNNSDIKRKKIENNENKPGALYETFFSLLKAIKLSTMKKLPRSIVQEAKFFLFPFLPLYFQYNHQSKSLNFERFLTWYTTKKGPFAHAMFWPLTVENRESYGSITCYNCFR